MRSSSRWTARSSAIRSLTAKGETRAQVALRSLDTLWFNTGTLCNLTCRNCYIESSPRNDRLAYLTRDEVRDYLDEITREGLPTQLIGFTGGEPFMNPDIIAMLRRRAVARFRRSRADQRDEADAQAAASAAGVARVLMALVCASACRSITTRLRCTRRSEDGEAGRRRSMAWSGWRATGLPSTSPAGASPASRKRNCAPASHGCSPNSMCRSMRPIRCG